jgi:cytochrome P450
LQKTIPAEANVFSAMDGLVKDHADAEMFLMDYWPAFEPVLMITGPDIAIQASTKYDLPKPHGQESSFRPIVGGPSFITMNDAQWKQWRSIFNPGFSASHMLSLVPSIVDSMNVFCKILEEHVGKKDVFSLDDMATRLTMDVMLKTSL